MTKKTSPPEETNRPPAGEVLLYVTDDGSTRVECRFEAETIWLSQALMAELFDVTVPTINEHIKGLYDVGELDPGATIRKFRIVRQEGARQVTRLIDHYNLEAIVSVGFRVRSARGTQFRRWANARLQEYLVKGFALDDQRLKNPPIEGSGIPDYFDELLERIRDIRASERRVYLRVREIFALAADYAPNAKDTATFFQVIQNKLHFAATGATAAEIIARRADRAKPNMGLTSWKNAPEGLVVKSDVSTAKNYLDRDEIDGLNRIVVMWLDFAEDQAKRRQQVFLKDWETKLGEFLAFNERAVLQNAGSVSHSQAKAHAEAEYDRFSAERRRMLEAEGERVNLASLEAQAKALPKTKPKS